MRLAKIPKEELKAIQRKAIIAKREKALASRCKPTQPKSYKLVPLNTTQCAKVDNQDFEWISKEVWRLSTGGYAINDYQPRRMHRRIMEKKLGRPLLRSEDVDHKNRDRTDNRRKNLRIATRQENLRYGRKSGGPSKSKYKGVVWNKQKNKWQAIIGVGGAKVHLGFFDDELGAAYRYDQFALQLYGRFAYLNVL